MSWVGIDSSGVAYTFTTNTETETAYPSISGSVVSIVGQLPNSDINTWALTFDDSADRNIRITAQSYSSSADGNELVGEARFEIGSSSGTTEQENQEALGTSQSAFSPAQFSATGSGIAYTGANSSELTAVESYAFLIEVEVADVVVPTGGRHIPQKKTLYMAEGETRVVSQEWAGECEERSATIESSTWSASDGSTLSGQALSGTKTTAVYTPIGHLSILRNTVTLNNGETLTAWRYVEVQRHG